MRNQGISGIRHTLESLADLRRWLRCRLVDQVELELTAVVYDCGRGEANK